MRKLLIITGIFGFHFLGNAQENPVVEQQIENLTEVSESETEDDTYIQSLRQYARNRLNLNTASETELKEFPFITPLQIGNLLTYRRIFGKLLSIYELQAVPTWDQETIQKILPYVAVGPAVSLTDDFRLRFKDGEHTLLARMSYTLEKARGFAQKDNPAATSFYPGGRERLLVRYRYTYKNLLQYGFTAEKDPGEQWFKGAQRSGFDFYSAHLFARNIGIIKAVALGDFTVNMGQGLIQWQSLAFRKSVDIVNIKRQATVLRPYNAAGEYFFQRGAGITIEKKHIQATAFASFRRVDGSLQVDTLSSEDFFSSINVSGLRRTTNEQARKNTVQMNSVGGNISYNKNNLHLGVNAIQYEFSNPLVRDSVPYNNFAFRGKQLTNFSFDWSYTWRNLHWFGEAANHNKNNYAMISGLLMSVDPKVDLSFVYRNIQKGYQTIFGNAFTEGTFPTNEKGMFGGVSIKPNSKWRIDGYADIYRFPWLRFRIDAPSYGKDFLAQVTHRPNKQLEIYMRYRTESKALNSNPDGALPMPVVDPLARQNFRVQWQYKISSSITIRNRFDAMWYDIDGPLESRGFLTFVDIFYRPMMKPLSANMRLQYFETDNFDSRIYAFENDVLYSFSIPAFFDKGYKYYMNLNYDFSKKLSLWLRWAQLIYKDRDTVGSGLDEIQGNKRTDVRLQVLVKF
jgi:hypothetical protein